MIDHRMRDAIKAGLEKYFLIRKEKRKDIPEMTEDLFLTMEHWNVGSLTRKKKLEDL